MGHKLSCAVAPAAKHHAVAGYTTQTVPACGQAWTVVPRGACGARISAFRGIYGRDDPHCGAKAACLRGPIVSGRESRVAFWLNPRARTRSHRMTQFPHSMLKTAVFLLA